MPDPVPTTAPCRRCGQPASAQFAGSGLCAACAASSLLDHTRGDRSSLSPFPDTAGAPASIGPYQIIETLGAGGMGTVYLAQHRQLGRIVALKVIPLDGAHALRFQREARTIAALRHPHIVSVHDAGQDARHLYFAMDYFEGGDLAARLRRERPSAREAAALMRKIADAVAHSHAQGMLHRDLKPSNILLDGDEPRVADFGLAAPLEHGGDLTQHTSVLGTPHYLAPEALLKGSAAQSRAGDVYSLGVILYELLCGRLPHTAATPAELQQRIVATEPLAPRLLNPQLPGDLETICLKAIAADPARRYATAAAFAEDLRRFLAGEPILARPVSVVGQLWRWARRRPALAALWLVLILVAAGSTAAAWRINRERRTAEAEAAKSRALLDFLTEDLLGSSLQQREPDPEIKLRTVVDRAADSLDARFTAQPQLAEPISRVVGELYQSLGDYPKARAHYARAATLAAAQYGATDLRTVQAEARLGALLVNMRAFPEARAILDPTLEKARATFGAESIAACEVATIVSNLLIGEGKLDEAAAHLEKTLAVARRLNVSRETFFCDLLVNLAGVYGRQQNYPACIALLDEALRLSREIRGPMHPDTLAIMQSLGVAYLGSNRNAEAERLLNEVLAGRRKTLGPEHPRTLVTLGSLVRVQLALGHHEAASAAGRELLETRRRLLGPEHPDTLRSLEGLAFVYLDWQHYDEATVVLTECLAGRRKVLGPQHADSLTSARTLAYAHLQQRQPAAAIALLEKLPLPAGRSVPAQWTGAIQQAILGIAYLQAGAPGQAEPLLLAAQPVLIAQRKNLTLFWPAFADTLTARLEETQQALARERSATAPRSEPPANPALPASP